jgi:hypothetical protein
LGGIALTEVKCLRRQVFGRVCRLQMGKAAAFRIIQPGRGVIKIGFMESLPPPDGESGSVSNNQARRGVNRKSGDECIAESSQLNIFSNTGTSPLTSSKPWLNHVNRRSWGGPAPTFHFRPANTECLKSVVTFHHVQEETAASQ